jgi:hypothetical protein
MLSSERLRFLDEIIHGWTVSSWILEVKMLMLVIPQHSQSKVGGGGAIYFCSAALRVSIEWIAWISSRLENKIRPLSDASRCTCCLRGLS